jgi:galactonate dehydratase
VLLGGPARERIRVYGWIGGDRPEDVAAAALRRQAEGLGAVKMNATADLAHLDSEHRIEEAAERVATVRAACGPAFDVAVDFHGRVHRAMAKRLCRALEAHRPLFIEEPALPEHPEALRQIARHTSVPIAAGERLDTRWGFKDVLAAGLVDVIQPDVSHAGGLLECDEEVVRAAATLPRKPWRNPVWRHADGVVAEW